MKRTRAALWGAFLMTATVSSLNAPRAGAADAPINTIDPVAIAALQKMGAFLRAQPTMWVQSETTTDDVLPSGQKVQFGGTVDLKVRRPDRMRVDVTSDRKNEQIFYDGATFTVFQPNVGVGLGYFASFAAPPTIGQLVDVLEARYGIDLPLADLFRLGTDTAQLAAIKGATVVGPGTVKGAVCVHYAFHQADVDWELWIEAGSQPLPRKLVITTTTERTQPQHVSVMGWNLAPRLDAGIFTFSPPPQAQRIDFDVPGAARVQPMPQTPTRSPAGPIQGDTP